MSPWPAIQPIINLPYAVTMKCTTWQISGLSLTISSAALTSGASCLSSSCDSLSVSVTGLPVFGRSGCISCASGLHSCLHFSYVFNLRDLFVGINSLTDRWVIFEDPLVVPVGRNPRVSGSVDHVHAAVQAPIKGRSMALARAFLSQHGRIAAEGDGRQRSASPRTPTHGCALCLYDCRQRASSRLSGKECFHAP